MGELPSASTPYSSDCTSSSHSSDSDIDYLVDEFIEKFSSFNTQSQNMTIKKHKDRVRSDKKTESLMASTSASRASNSYRQNRIRSRASRSDGASVINPSARSQKSFPYQYTDSSKCKNNPSFDRRSPLLLSVPQSSDLIDPLVLNTPVDQSFDSQLGVDTATDAENNSEDEYINGSRTRLSTLQLKNKEHFSPYITEDFERYIDRKRDPTCHGNSIEIQAISELYNRPVEIYRDSIEPINVFHAEYPKEFPLRLSYHAQIHYNSVFDPFNPSFGKGLGMPDYQPSVIYSQNINKQLAESDLVTQAILASEETQIQEIIHTTLVETDRNEIENCLEARAIEDSYETYLQQINKSNIPPSEIPDAQFHPRHSIASSSKSIHLQRPSPSSSASSRTFPSDGLIPEEFQGLDEESIMSIVLQRSREDYLTKLSGKPKSPNNDGQS